MSVKHITEERLLAALATLKAEQRAVPSVEDVARVANISRATAYRCDRLIDALRDARPAPTVEQVEALRNHNRKLKRDLRAARRASAHDRRRLRKQIDVLAHNILKLTLENKWSSPAFVDT